MRFTRIRKLFELGEVEMNPKPFTGFRETLLRELDRDAPGGKRVAGCSPHDCRGEPMLMSAAFVSRILTSSPASA